MGNAPICQNHNVAMTWKTGFSNKTGRNYAFWACGQKNPDGSFCNYKAPQNTPAPNVQYNRPSDQAFANGLDQSSNDQKWAQINAKKEASIAWMNAKNNACILYAATLSKGDQVNLQIVQALARDIYTLTPSSPVQTPAAAAYAAVPPVPTPAQPEINVEDIPF